MLLKIYNKVLNTCYKGSTITKPSTTDGWNTIKEGFQQIAGFPNVIGAIDGTLIAIKRFKDKEGWFCRKGFTALNMQAVCDHKMRLNIFNLDLFPTL